MFHPSVFGVRVERNGGKKSHLGPSKPATMQEIPLDLQNSPKKNVSFACNLLGGSIKLIPLRVAPCCVDGGYPIMSPEVPQQAPKSSEDVQQKLLKPLDK